MSLSSDPFFQPTSAMDLARFAGMPSFMRLPYLTQENSRFGDIDIGILGAPWDTGTTNRPGARHGPRQLRDLSTMIRTLNPVTGVNPFASANCADVGDISPNPVDIADSLERVTRFVSTLTEHKIIPLTAGGDHLITLPILRAIAKRNRSDSFNLIVILIFLIRILEDKNLRMGPLSAEPSKKVWSTQSDLFKLASEEPPIILRT